MRHGMIMQSTQQHEPPIPPADPESVWQQYSAADFGADHSQARACNLHSFTNHIVPLVCRQEIVIRYQVSSFCLVCRGLTLKATCRQPLMAALLRQQLSQSCMVTQLPMVRGKHCPVLASC